MRVLIADSQALLRQGVRVVLADLDDDVGVVEVDNTFDLLARAADRPFYDLVIVDLVLAEMAAGDGISGVCRRFPDVPVVILSASENPGDMKFAIASGARGYVLKSSRPAALLYALRLVLAGEAYVPPAVLNQVGVAPLTGLHEDDETGVLRKLTPREREILDQLVAGRSNKQIAMELAINEGTVKVHLKAVLRKLGVSNRTQAAMLAVRSGWPTHPLAAI
jgi:DNA-binding NarL/FixJ family response regulator